jgi:hypothetical protein
MKSWGDELLEYDDEVGTSSEATALSLNNKSSGK